MLAKEKNRTEFQCSWNRHVPPSAADFQVVEETHEMYVQMILLQIAPKGFWSQNIALYILHLNDSETIRQIENGCPVTEDGRTVRWGHGEPCSQGPISQ